MHEGPDMAKHVIELMGEEILMLGTDYPHAESRFPDSVDLVLDWRHHGVTDSSMKKMAWDNAVRCFGEP
jgi:microsomal dipeptidase-like Zn-dependent dipeptidase